MPCFTAEINQFHLSEVNKNAAARLVILTSELILFLLFTNYVFILFCAYLSWQRGGLLCKGQKMQICALWLTEQAQVFSL